MLYQRRNPKTGELEFVMADWKRMGVLDNRQYHKVPGSAGKDQAAVEQAEDEEFDRVVKKFFDGSASADYFASKRSSRLYYRLNLVAKAFQAPWMMTR
eukprot:GSA25T00003908001.1